MTHHDGVAAAHGEPAHTNRLIHETSPYLLQHAHNPVDWYSWGDEAFARARAEDKPILLSIGYSACHWCHVMAHESFENEATAAIMNREFVSVKVDREERPDVDALYMQATIQMTGGGGWPMTVFLMPDGAPFLAGTYFPPVDRHGMPGFPRLLTTVAQWYATRRDEVEQQAQAMREVYRTQAERALPLPPGLSGMLASDAGADSAALDPTILAQAANADLADFDAQEGGLQRPPKFPHPLGLDFLLRMERRRRASGAARAGAEGLSDDLTPLVTLTLDKMAAGGIYDQVGGGFHRYSTDAIWLVPHFEKMLYDNALLAPVYLRAWQLTDEPRYRRVCEETLDYLLREMTDPSGAFYSTQDADSAGEEGKFYVWTPAELRAALGDDDAALAQTVWGVTERGNFEGSNILHVARTVDEAARTLGMDVAEAQAALARARERLYAARAQRIWPGRDDKAITAWNALALRAVAEAASALSRDDYRAAARKNADFLLTTMLRDGRLLRTWRNGQAKIDAYLEDYAALANALISVYELTGEPRYFVAARSLGDEILRRFWDEPTQAFFDTAADHERLIGRPRELSDNATPSGSSQACEALLRLAALTGDARYHERAARVLLPLIPHMLRSPSAFGRYLCALDDLIGPFYEVALVGAADDPRLLALRMEVANHYQPRMALAWGAPAPQPAVPLLEQRGLLAGAPAAYVCQGFVCQRPVASPEELRALLAG
jgi:hypothetical protein